MGNKKKVGKQRRDKYYQLAKESGFRARSAFKLIQLNRKFEFLQNSRVVIDLCAAPGGWLQVAAENCPISSLIVGVDLVPIKPIRNVTTLVDDITTDKCRQDLKKELQTWQADCVLHDGAPNVGKSWVHDAFQQVQLTLSALKLATELLKKGGWFITKVFRSKDYNALMWVMQQLFKNVQATKPQSSRNESAEIFVVCEYYLAPDKIDPKFLDLRHVFKEVDKEKKTSLDLIHPEKHKRHREGYPEGDYTLFHTLKVTEFLAKENYLELLADASEVIFDDPEIENHPTTTPEIKECLKDIKVLGKREIRLVINWRKKIVKERKDKQKAEVGADDKPAEVEEEKGSEDEIEKLEAQLAELEGEEKKALKRKIKKTRREKSKLQHKMDLKMVLPNDPLDFSNDMSLFDLNKIRSGKQLKKVEEIEMSDLEDEEKEEEEESDDEPAPSKKKKIAFDRESKDYLDANGYPVNQDSDEDSEMNDDSSDDELPLEDADDADANPLLIGKQGSKEKTNMWFSKESFAGLDDDEDEDVEIEKTVEEYQKKGGIIRGVNDVKSVEKTSDSAIESGSGSDDDSDESDSDVSDNDSDSDSDYDTKEFYKQQTASAQMSRREIDKAKDAKKEGFEVVASENKAPVRLSAKGLALGAAIVSSRKRRRELIESGYNRNMFDDDDLPEWFKKDEMKHRQTQLPITKGEIEEYKLKMKAIDANPIKKIAEAKMRKKKKMAKKLERVRKKAEAINEVTDVTDKEKWQQIKQVYKKAGLLSAKKKEVTYVVAKKGNVGKRVRRPKGVSGPFRVVDGRMKKDKLGEKRAEARKNKGKKRR